LVTRSRGRSRFKGHARRSIRTSQEVEKKFEASRTPSFRDNRVRMNRILSRVLEAFEAITWDDNRPAGRILPGVHPAGRRPSPPSRCFEKSSRPLDAGLQKGKLRYRRQLGWPSRCYGRFRAPTGPRLAVAYARSRSSHGVAAGLVLKPMLAAQSAPLERWEKSLKGLGRLVSEIIAFERTESSPGF